MSFSHRLVGKLAGGIGRLLCLACLAAFAGNLPVVAQTAGGQTQSRGPIAEDLLKSLQEFRKLQNGMPELNLPSANANPGEDPYEQRLRSIQQRMELIRNLVQQREQAEAARQSGGGEPAAGHSMEPAEGHHTAEPHLPAAGAGEHPENQHSVPRPPDFPLPDLHADSADETSGAGTSVAPKYLGETVVPAAVDPLELANSLFQTGNYELALKTYLAVIEKVDRQQDALWTEYFIASCQRILGDLPNAEKGYRNLVESRRPVRPVEAARWWLDNVERRKSITETIGQIDAYLDGVSKELSSNGK